MYDVLTAFLLIAVILFFLVYKRKMLANLLSLDIAGQVKTFENDIEKTANSAVNKIAGASGDLSSLLVQAEETIEELKIRVKIAEEQLYKMSLPDLQQTAPPPVAGQAKSAARLTFAEQLMRASYQTNRHLDGEMPAPAQFITTPPAGQSKSPVAEEPAVAPPQKMDFDLDMAGAEPKFRQKQIMRLAANGYDDLFIARALRLGVGEVSLTRKLGKK